MQWWALLAVGGLDGSAVVVAAAAAAGSEQGDGEGGENGLIFHGILHSLCEKGAHCIVVSNRTDTVLASPIGNSGTEAMAIRNPAGRGFVVVASIILSLQSRLPVA